MSEEIKVCIYCGTAYEDYYAVCPLCGTVNK
jgi:hypothetical protein